MADDKNTQKPEPDPQDIDYVYALVLIVAALIYLFNGLVFIFLIISGIFALLAATSPKLFPQFQAPKKIASQKKVVFWTLAGLFIAGNVVNMGGEKTPEEAKADFIEEIKDESSKVKEVEVSSGDYADVEVHVSFTNIFSEGTFLHTAGQEIYDITREVYKDIPKFAKNQFMYVLYAPFDSGQERVMTIVYRVDTIKQMNFEKEVPYQSFLDSADRVIVQGPRAARNLVIKWCEGDNLEWAKRFCVKALN